MSEPLVCSSCGMRQDIPHDDYIELQVIAVETGDKIHFEIVEEGTSDTIRLWMWMGNDHWLQDLEQ